MKEPAAAILKSTAGNNKLATECGVYKLSSGGGQHCSPPKVKRGFYLLNLAKRVPTGTATNIDASNIWIPRPLIRIS